MSTSSKKSKQKSEKPSPDISDYLPRVMVLSMGSLSDQIYSLEDEQGWQYHWNVTRGMELAQVCSSLTFFYPEEEGLTVEVLRLAYVGLDESYALTTDVTRPLLFLHLHGKMQLVDGWHRLFKAVTLGIPCLPAYVLSEEEAETILMLKLPPGAGLNWGQYDDGSVL